MNAGLLPVDAPVAPAGTPLYEAAGCGRPLTPVQVQKDARACSVEGWSL